MMNLMSLGSILVLSTNSTLSISAPVDTVGMDVDDAAAASFAFGGVEGCGGQPQNMHREKWAEKDKREKAQTKDIASRG